MAWNTPPQYSATLQTVTAFNAYIRDNLLALKDPPSGLSYVSGRDYQIAGLGAFTAVDTALTDGHFQHLIVTRGGTYVKVEWNGSIHPKVNNGAMAFNVAVDGTDYFPAPGICYFDMTAMSANIIPLHYSVMLTGIAAGTHTFRLDWSGTHTAIKFECTGADGSPAMFYVTEAP